MWKCKILILWQPTFVKLLQVFVRCFILKLEYVKQQVKVLNEPYVYCKHVGLHILEPYDEYICVEFYLILKCCDDGPMMVVHGRNM